MAPHNKMLLKSVLKNKKAQEINLTTLIIVILCVLVLVFSVLLITGVLKPAQNSIIGKLGEAISSWKSNAAP